LKQAAWFSAIPWAVMALSGYVAGASADYLIKIGFSTVRVRKIMQVRESSEISLIQIEFTNNMQEVKHKNHHNTNTFSFPGAVNWFYRPRCVIVMFKICSNTIGCGNYHDRCFGFEFLQSSWILL
jgi:hypothetical protein